MNVTQLKALAKDMGITGLSGMRKAEIQDAIDTMIQAAEVEAHAENDAWMAITPEEVAYTNSLKVDDIHDQTVSWRNRIYSAQNGTWRLTAPQQRRINKKYLSALRKAGLTSGKKIQVA